MPACEVTDAHVAVWKALESGDEAESRRLFRKILPLLNIEAMYSFVVYKEVLFGRGIIACPRRARPARPPWTRLPAAELDLILRDLVAVADGADPGHSGCLMYRADAQPGRPADGAPRLGGRRRAPLHDPIR